jgi:hypothetical protein
MSLSSFLSVVAEQVSAIVNDGLSRFLVAKYGAQSNSYTKCNRAKRDLLLRVAIHCSFFPPCEFC